MTLDTTKLSRLTVEQTAEAIFWFDFENRICYVNEAACRSLGYSREELLSMRGHGQ